MANERIFHRVAFLWRGTLGLYIKKRCSFFLLNPVLIAIAGTIATLLVLDIDYSTYNRGAKYISYLLTPATVALAIPLYEQVSLLRKNFTAIMVGIASGARRMSWLKSTAAAVLGKTLKFLLAVVLVYRLLPLAADWLPEYFTAAVDTIRDSLREKGVS